MSKPKTNTPQSSPAQESSALVDPGLYECEEIDPHEHADRAALSGPWTRAASPAPSLAETTAHLAGVVETARVSLGGARRPLGTLLTLLRAQEGLHAQAALDLLLSLESTVEATLVLLEDRRGK